MLFGHSLAPAHFQSVMNHAISQARWEITTSVYLDDATIGNKLACETWRDTLECMKCLIKIGLPINIWKC
jgi:hypothetical protein